MLTVTTQHFRDPEPSKKEREGWISFQTINETESALLPSSMSFSLTQVW